MRGVKRSRFLLVALALVLFYTYLNAVWLLNDPQPPFKSVSGEGDIGQMIIDSASQVLQSNAQIFLFMNEIEIGEKGEIDFKAALNDLDAALRYLRSARRLLNEIVQSGVNAGYEPERIDLLVKFDYASFAVQNNLNREIFTEVASYLGQGDIIGFWRHLLGSMNELESCLDKVAGELRLGSRPQNEVLWSLLHSYTKVDMLGNYASLVFYHI